MIKRKNQLKISIKSILTVLILVLMIFGIIQAVSSAVLKFEGGIRLRGGTRIQRTCVPFLLFNGTGQGFTGGSQANGGVDDYNNGDAAPTDRYEGSWTDCVADNNYCGTGLASADARDDNTNLVWSLPCKDFEGIGCASFSALSFAIYTWDNSGAGNNSKTASELCSTGSHGESGWSLPHQKQLMQAYIDGSYENLEAAGIERRYWSVTTSSSTTTNAWRTNLSRGDTSDLAKTISNYVRCVR